MLKYFSTSQFKDALSSVYYSVHKHQLQLPVLKFNGTIKVHGANHSIVFNNNNYYCQSKNRILDESDPYQFSPFVEQNLDFLKNIKDKADEIFNMFLDKPNKKYDEKYIAEYLNQNLNCTIYGEWTGKNVQDGVAVSQLPNMFLLFAVRYSKENQSSDNDYWFSPDELTTLMKKSLKEKSERLKKETVDLNQIIDRVFFINEFPQYKIDIDMKNPKDAQEKLIELTQKTEDNCPVGKKFGVLGIGEGIVWSCESEVEKINTKSLIFKTKGKRHSIVKEKKIVVIDEEKAQTVRALVEMVVTENRLQQGMDYLFEMGKEKNIHSIGYFITFMLQDCMKEESERFINSGLDLKLIKHEIAKQSKNWFMKNMETEKKMSSNLTKF